MAVLGDHYRRQGRYGESEALLDRALEVRRQALGPEGAHVGQSLFFLGCLAAARGERDEALGLFRQAVDQGWAERWILDDDPDLLPLRGDPEFEAIVDEVKERIGEK
jgi:hypothetical protein